MLKDLNVAVVTHVFATGPAQELEEYLKDKVKCLFFAGHPFRYANPTNSFYKIYCGRSFAKKSAVNWRLPEFLSYFKDLFYTLFWVLKCRRKFDIYVGADSLNALAGVILQKLKLVKKTVFYTVDYAPKRFNNEALNRLYLALDGFCVKNCDYVWNLSEKMSQARIQNRSLKAKKEIIVPIGVHSERIKILPFDKIDRMRIVYMGHLRKFQGLELVIESLPRIISRISQVKLVIIGTGELEGKLKNRVAELGLVDNVEFKGYIEDHSQVEHLLSQCALGLALYEPTPESFTQFSDPSKPKQYMGCGLPVIITRVPWIAKEIEEKKCGLVINFDPDDFAGAVTLLISDENKLREYRQNAIEYSKEFSWDNIFDQAFRKFFSRG